jgi:hypothetical protein
MLCPVFVMGGLPASLSHKLYLEGLVILRRCMCSSLVDDLDAHAFTAMRVRRDILMGHP